ncbi:MAG: hypothetical protein KatS3mg092_0582 [Patescibacteria group bacterium]|nr:MAG: hypothetical protein KatS3mg092_0582 [Patescibacteria group bacterium]
MDKKLSKKLILELKEKLLKDKEKSLTQIEELKKEDPFQDPDHASDNAAIDTDVREQMGHETIEAQIKDLEQKVADIDNALRKIAKDRYGVCERCKKTNCCRSS